MQDRLPFIEFGGMSARACQVPIFGVEVLVTHVASQGRQSSRRQTASFLEPSSSAGSLIEIASSIVTQFYNAPGPHGVRGVAAIILPLGHGLMAEAQGA